MTGLRPRSSLRSVVVLLALGSVAAALGACAEANSGAPPGSDASASSGDATVCGPQKGCCAKDVDCLGNQKCDPTSHQCVDCSTDENCPPGQTCQTQTHTCVMGCSKGHGCGDAGMCELDLGQCIECAQDADCTSPKAPRCDVTMHRCVACLPSSDNCGHATYCASQGQMYTCAPGCKDDSDCTSGGGVGDGGVGDGGPKDAGGGGDGGTGSAKCDKKAHQCVQCLGDDQCPAGSVCQNGTCVPGCTNQHSCSTPYACCGGMCADTKSDPANCGLCGKACTPGWQCCGGACFDPASDVMNCNGCGNVCSFPHAAAACKNRQCIINMCDPGFAHCTGNLANGCETNIDTNVANCGGCNNPCSLPNANPKCVGGKCQVKSCMLGFAHCSSDPTDGCEQDIFGSVNHCGGCNTKCMTPHATPKCSLGMCAIGACDPGWADCNNNPADGCEVNLLADPKNCAACNKACPSTQGLAQCNNGICGIQCKPGYANCSGDPATGCETNLTTDPAHCGTCGTSCGKGPHVAGVACSNGTCAIAQCEANYYNVPSGFANGCSCFSDQSGASCTSAVALGQLFVNQATTVSANLVGAAERWYQVTFQQNTSTQYHPRVTFSNNPGGIYRFDIYSTCGSVYACTVKPASGAAVGLVDWDVRYTAGDPAHNFEPIPAVGNGGSVLIRVTRLAGTPTCDPFTLSVRNLP